MSFGCSWQAGEYALHSELILCENDSLGAY